MRAASSEPRLRSILLVHRRLVENSLRRSGTPVRRLDEAISRVFDIVHRRLEDIELGKEERFLTRVCGLVGSEFRRAEIRAASRAAPLDQIEAIASEQPSPEEVLDNQRARAFLDEALDALDANTRAAFVLHEIEQHTMSEIARDLGLPAGTIASRLRRGRKQFAEAAGRIRRRVSDSEMQQAS